MLFLVNNYKVYSSQLQSSVIKVEADKTYLDLIKIEYESGIRKYKDIIDINSYYLFEAI